MQNIVEQIRLDGRKTLEAVYHDHRDEFMQWARRHHQCQEEESLEIFQDTVVTLYENIMQGKLTELTSSLKTYLCAIGKHKIMELRRYGQKFQPADGLDFQDEANLSISEDLLNTTRESISRLDNPCRDLLLDFYYHGSTMQQLASTYGYKNEDTAKSQKYRCLQSLRKIFNEIRISNEA